MASIGPEKVLKNVIIGNKARRYARLWQPRRPTRARNTRCEVDSVGSRGCLEKMRRNQRPGELMDNRPASSGEREFSHATISSAMGSSTAPVARIFCNRRASLSARVWMTVGDIAQIKALHAQRSLLGEGGRFKGFDCSVHDIPVKL
jgi:hypothetical protein